MREARAGHPRRADLRQRRCPLRAHAVPSAGGYRRGRPPPDPERRSVYAHVLLGRLQRFSTAPGRLHMKLVVLAALAASCFTVGGVFMKHADGLHHAGATAGFLALFVLGAVVQSQAMRGEGLAVTYLIVLGLEAALAV